MTFGEVAALAMGMAALIGLYFRNRETKAGESSSEVESVSRLLADLKSTHDQIDVYREQLEASRDQEDDCQASLQEERRKHTATMAELGVLMQRCAKMEAATPALKIAGKIDKLSPSLMRVFDKCHDGIVLSSIAEAGRFVYVNKTFANALGMTPEEVLKAGWRALIHPDDVPDTESVESNAWIEGGEVVNRYRHVNGSWIQMRWHFTKYESGDAFCVVWPERRKTDVPIVTGEA